MGRLTSLPSAVITDDSALGGAIIGRSLRFSHTDSAYLTRTFGSAGNRRTFTFSSWIKFSATGTSWNGNNAFFSGSKGGVGFFKFMVRDDGRIELNTSETGASDSSQLRTTAHFRDPNAWYHIVVAYDTTQGTASNRVKFYVNGTQETAFDTNTLPPQNHEVSVNADGEHQIGNQVGTSNYFDGYMAEVHFIDGFQLDPSYFGFTEFQTGIWKPKGYFGSYGTNGFRLDFSDNSATTAVTLGKDRSGQGNDFTPTNFSVSAGVNNDSFLESPTAKKEFATFNSNLQTSSSTEYRNGNLAFYTSGSSQVQTRANFSRNSGKWYAEFTLTTFTIRSGSYPYIGVAPAENFSNTWTGEIGTAYNSAGNLYRNGSSLESGHATYAAGDIISVAINLDLATPQVWWAKNGTYIRHATANPATGLYGVNIEPASTSGNYTFAMSLYANPGQWDANFGQRAFAHSVPAGYKTLSTDNFSINTPSLIRPQKYFGIVKYSGNGSSPRAIGGLEFRPDFVWLKNRNSTNWHRVQNSIAGPHNTMYSNSTAAEAPNESNGHVDSFTDDGFIVDDASGAAVNGGSNTYVAWCWKGGGDSNTFNIDGVGYASAAAAGLNTGTITPTGASINTESGFSIITYTANGTSGATIPHGLGKKPGWIIIKCRSNTDNWMVYHHDIDTSSPEDYYLELNATGQRVNSAVMLNDTAPTSTLVTVQNDGSVNSGSRTYIMHSWAEIPGYSKFGVYLGNASTDGPYVELGFRPAFVMTKSKDGINENWTISDSTRSTLNDVNLFLRSDENSQETSGAATMDFLSNGFKLRGTDTKTNRTGTNYVYMAFAEQIGDSPYHTDTNAR